MQDRNPSARILRIVRIVRPSIGSKRSRMVFQVEHFNNPFPYRVAIKSLFHWHALNVRGLSPMYPADNVFQFFDVAHATASSKFYTVQKSRSTPAAIAGVQRNELCRFTKL